MGDFEGLTDGGGMMGGAVGSGEVTEFDVGLEDGGGVVGAVVVDAVVGSTVAVGWSKQSASVGNLCTRCECESRKRNKGK